MPAPPAWKPVVTLVPFSGVQFLDFAFSIDDTPRLQRSFLERSDPARRREDGSQIVKLEPLTGDPERDAPILDPPRDGDDLYEVSKIRALEPFLGKWTPVPVLRVRPGRGEMGEELLDTGPTTWARLRVSACDETIAGGRITHRVVLAFDTELAERVPQRPYLAPSFQDATDGQEFRFAATPEEVAWFLAWPEPETMGGQDVQSWVDDWLRELFKEFKLAQRGGRPLREGDLPHRFEHWARYLTLLELLAQAIHPPRVKLLDTVSPQRRYEPVKVDLVLDLGNSRSCGILIETYPDKPVDLNDSYRLALRDLSRPERSYDEPFASQVEFAQADFGEEHLARRSGRARALFWPSLVRVGPEAVRMASEAEGTEVTSGMSSPKRYLWSTKPVEQEWRFQKGDYSAAGDDPQIARAARRFLTETGDVIRQVVGEERGGLRRSRPDSKQPAIRSKFSRSSLWGFLLAEVTWQALVQINDPGGRASRPLTNVPRRLRQIIVTLPPATPLAEQRIMRSRADGAVKLLWDLMGWTQATTPGVAEPPSVVIRWDEASCAHLVWLYSEITQKFAGQIRDFFQLLGRPRPFVDEPRSGPRGSPEPSLRIASIDIGGGTSDLMITTYHVEENRALKPTQNFREGFKIAGDDILEGVIRRILLPALEAELEAQGARNAKELMKDLFGGDRASMAEQQKQLRRLFVTRALVPIAIAQLRALEDGDPFGEQAPESRLFGEFFGHGPDAPASAEPAKLIGAAVAAYVEQAAQRAGAAGFSLARCSFPVDVRRVDLVVRNVLGQVIDLLAEAVAALDCDLVLVAGRPSRLPTIAAMLVERLPVSPDRIVPMHLYRVGSWYPFRSAEQDRIHDPKTTAAVGGMLCALAERQLSNFTIYASRLIMRSTARFIGEMETNGQIKDERLIFSDIDLDQKAAQTPAEGDVKLYAPMLIGFRQLPLERWMATPLYRLEFSEGGARRPKPFTVTLERADVDLDPDDSDERRQEAEASREEFRVTEVIDATRGGGKSSDVTLRLQTMAEETYWLDTGAVLRTN